jgi:hypothetical protein
MTTARLREYLEPTRQKNANAVQIYKDVSNNIKQKREEARACHNLDLSVDLGCLQLECKLYLRKRIERAAREAPGNESSEFENLKTRLDDAEERIRLMLVAWEDSRDVSFYCLEKDYHLVLLYKRIGELNSQYDKGIVGRALEIEKELTELDDRIDTEDMEAMETISEIEEELKDICKKTPFLIKETGLEDPKLGIICVFRKQYLEQDM